MDTIDLFGSGMTKLIYSGVMPDNFDVQLSIIEDPARFVKSAAASGGLFDYEALKPDADHVGIHVLALGDAERYGANRNGDLFSKSANQKYHDTFVKLGAVFRHHQNKDRNKSLGKIAASAHNDEMSRVELFLHANKKAAAEELDRLEKNGEIPVSMACRVSYDRCSICNNLRKSSKDPNQCDHVKYELGKVAEDGRITGTWNDEPRFFDLSFVWRPADRIAWSLKTASDGLMDSVKLAEEAGLYLPENVALDSDHKMAKLAVAKEIAAMERKLQEIAANGPKTPAELRLWEFRKAACTRLTKEALDALRAYEPADTFRILAERGIVMGPQDFFTYIMGKSAADLPLDGVCAAVAGIFDELEKQGQLTDLAADGSYDAGIVDPYADNSRRLQPLEKLAADVQSIASFDPAIAGHRAIEATVDGFNPTISPTDKNFGGELEKYLATRYAMYKLAAVCAMKEHNRNLDECTVALGPVTDSAYSEAALPPLVLGVHSGFHAEIVAHRSSRRPGSLISSSL